MDANDSVVGEGPSFTNHTHSHSGTLTLTPEDRRRVRFALACVVIPIALLTMLGLFIFWPTTGTLGGSGSTAIASRAEFAPGTEKVIGEISFIGQTDENRQTPVKMKIDGVEVGVHVPYEYVHNGLDVGDRINAIFSPGLIETDTPYIFVDFVRAVPVWILITLYILVVLIVARGKGLAAVLGLGVSLAVVAAFMLPALMAGKSPIMVVIIGAVSMMFTSIYLAHGISIRTTTAILGTLGGLLITGVVAWISIDSINLTGTYGEESVGLYSQLGYLRMDQILLCGMILAGLGALNDVTITQVSTVWELHAANPAARRRKIFRQAMIIGRDHIASTVYTLAFAYVGSALPLLMSATLVDRGFVDFLMIGQVTEEIVRTLVASVGLVLAIPMTTAIATIFAPVAPTTTKENTDE
ncbi:YibE/F family protein [Arcanobacterium phocisimile]|uniref:YibE/F family protein n=1 Tax=Arcanobacterium phocisimile TaxID=1302235 RepID=A0ABX7IJ83_9ACTO|nr:YibE/F family protein [Arcanobacterium phocisimile]